MEALAAIYQDALGHAPTAIILRELLQWAEEMDMCVIAYALTEAASAPRPSWRYASAILRRCKGIRLPAPRPGLTDHQRVELGRGMLLHEQRKEARHKARQQSDDSTILELPM